MYDSLYTKIFPPLLNLCVNTPDFFRLALDSGFFRYLFPQNFLFGTLFARLQACQLFVVDSRSSPSLFTIKLVGQLSPACNASMSGVTSGIVSSMLLLSSTAGVSSALIIFVGFAPFPGLWPHPSQALRGGHIALGCLIMRFKPPRVIVRFSWQRHL